MQENQLTALEDLTDKQAAFVSAYVANAGNHVEAAKTAGYKDRGEGQRLLKHPNVLKALQLATMDELQAGAALALGTVRALILNARSEYVKLEAAKDWLDRAGYKPPDRVLMKVSGDLNVSFDVSETEGGVKNAVTSLQPPLHP